MKIGQSRKNITPTEEFYLIGYKSPIRNNPADGIHDEIFINGMLIEINQKKMYIVSMDLLEIEDAMADELKTLLSEKYGMVRDLILLCATHNHSSLMSYHKNWHSGVFDQDYYDFLINSVIELYQECENKLETAEAYWGSKIIEGYYGNRNHFGQLADNEVILIDFINKDKKTVGQLLNIAVHSTVLSAENNYLTNELAGQICVKIKEKSGVYPLVIVGAAADSSNRHQRLGNDFNELERVSSALSGEILKIDRNKLLKLGDIKYQSLSHTIYNNMIKTHQEIKEFLNSGSPLINKGLIKKCEDILNTDYFYLSLEFNVYDLGGLQLYAFPGELGSKFGKELKQACLERNKMGIVACYTNGFHHYFMPKEEYGLSFETIGNPVPKSEAEKIVSKMMQSARLLGLDNE